MAVTVAVLDFMKVVSKLLDVTTTVEIVSDFDPTDTESVNVGPVVPLSSNVDLCEVVISKFELLGSAVV